MRTVTVGLLGSEATWLWEVRVDSFSFLALLGKGAFMGCVCVRERER